MDPEVWILAGGLALTALQFAYQVWRDRSGDEPDNEQGEPPSAAA